MGDTSSFCSQFSSENAIRDEFGTSLSMNFGMANCSAISSQMPPYVHALEPHSTKIIILKEKFGEVACVTFKSKHFAVANFSLRNYIADYLRIS